MKIAVAGDSAGAEMAHLLAEHLKSKHEVAELSTPDDYLDLDRAARATKAVGWSIYDYATTWSWAWPYLRGEVPVPTTLVPPTTVAPTTTSTTSTTTTTTTAPVQGATP